MAPLPAARPPVLPLPLLLPLAAAAPSLANAGSPVLGVRLEAVAGEAVLQRVEGLASRVEADGDREHVGQTRNFGEGQAHEGGHSVTFLHAHVEEHFPGLVDLLWSLGERADAEAGWGIASSLGSSGRPGLRCLELITYFARPETSEASDKSLSNSLGWHVDGHTLLTVAVLLSQPGVDFAGGGIEVRRREGGEERWQRLAPARGDAAVWRGWDYHRVRPVESGARRVLVAEFWVGPDVRGDETRLPDFEEGFQEAVSIDPSSAYLYSNLAWAQLDREDLSAASASAERGLAADPTDADLSVLLSMVHRREGRLAEAGKLLERALELRPGDAVALMALAEVRAEQGDHDDAERCYVGAVAAEPENSHALSALGEHRERQGRLAEAVEAYRQVLRLAPDDEAALAGLERAAEAERSKWLVGLVAAAAVGSSALFLRTRSGASGKAPA